MHRWLAVLIAFHCSVCFARTDTLFFDSGQVRAIIGKTDDGSTMDGLYAVWHQNGQPRVTGSYRNGQPFGLWKYYNESGVLQRQVAQDDSSDFVISRSGSARSGTMEPDDSDTHSDKIEYTCGELHQEILGFRKMRRTGAGFLIAGGSLVGLGCAMIAGAGGETSFYVSLNDGTSTGSLGGGMGSIFASIGLPLIVVGTIISPIAFRRVRQFKARAHDQNCDRGIGRGSTEMGSEPVSQRRRRTQEEIVVP